MTGQLRHSLSSCWGLDVDALRDVAAAVNGLKRPNAGLLMITHYKRPGSPPVPPHLCHICR